MRKNIPSCIKISVKVRDGEWQITYIMRHAACYPQNKSIGEIRMLTKPELVKGTLATLAVAAGVLDPALSIGVGLADVFGQIIIDEYCEEDDVDKLFIRAYNAAKKKAFKKASSKGDSVQNLLAHVGTNILSQCNTVDEAVEHVGKYLSEKSSDEDIRIVSTILEDCFESEIDKYPMLRRKNVNHRFDSIDIAINKLMQDHSELSELAQEWQILLPFLRSLYNKTADLNRSNVDAVIEMYADTFEQVMFLHRTHGSSRVTMSNLYVKPRFSIIEAQNNVTQGDELDSFIKEFLCDAYSHALFIEGDAGIGKSSLVSYLAYHYRNSDEVAKNIFGEYQIVCVRLRDIVRETMHFTKDDPISDIFTYLNVKKMEDIASDAKYVFILDGFDELCMVEDMHANSSFFMTSILLALCDYKVIVTTRPRYLDVASIDFTKKHISLLHYNRDQRLELLHHYQNRCKQHVEEHVLEYVKNTSNQLTDSPMVLYMLLSNHIPKNEMGNLWALYHRVFSRELSRTNYNKMFPNSSGNVQHAISKYSKQLYRLSSEISFRLFQNGNRAFHLSEKGLKSLISSMDFPAEKDRAIAESCYALCAYWKNENKGAIEFLHNEIRDFFLCEKIMSEMNTLYEKVPFCNIQEHIRILQDLFQYAELSDSTAKFLYLRAQYKLSCDLPDNMLNVEMENPRLGEIFQYMVVKSPIIQFDSSDLHPHDMMCNTLAGTALLYRLIYEPYLSLNRADTYNLDAYIKWWGDVKEVNRSTVLRNLFKRIFLSRTIDNVMGERIHIAGYANFSELDLTGTDLREVRFGHSLMQGAILTGSIAYGADFSYAILLDASFMSADVGKTTFVGAKMGGVKLSGVKIYDTMLPNGVLTNEYRAFSGFIGQFNGR